MVDKQEWKGIVFSLRSATLIGVDTDNTTANKVERANKITKWSLRALDRLPESRYM